jgi:hypothetical protein
MDSRLGPPGIILAAAAALSHKRLPQRQRCTNRKVTSPRQRRLDFPVGFSPERLAQVRRLTHANRTVGPQEWRGRLPQRADCQMAIQRCVSSPLQTTVKTGRDARRTTASVVEANSMLPSDWLGRAPMTSKSAGGFFASATISTTRSPRGTIPFTHQCPWISGPIQPQRALQASSRDSAHAAPALAAAAHLREPGRPPEKKSFEFAGRPGQISRPPRGRIARRQLAEIRGFRAGEAVTLLSNRARRFPVSRRRAASGVSHPEPGRTTSQKSRRWAGRLLDSR